ncbi:MAG: MarR family transcriptional regulator [Anaerolineales bacterium]|nr:MarR family transcriptional regulator [Anaerolineales bacterium]
MSTPNELHDRMREWIEVLVGRSMRDLILYLKQHDLSMAQYGTLMRIFHQGSCAVMQVGSHLGITNAAASQMVDKLVQQGLLERSEAEHDRRMKQLSLTEKGRELVQRAYEARLGWLEQLADALPPERRAAATELMAELAHLAQRLDQPPAAPEG